MDDIIDSFPEALFKDASPQPNKIGFHPDTQRECKEGKLEGVVAKIVAAGDYGVGQTDIIRCICDNSKPTYEGFLEIKKYVILETAFKMEIWNMAGQERFRTITDFCYRKSHAILVVFDLCRPDTLAHVRVWIEDALHYTKEVPPDIFVVGNNKDKCEASALQDMREEAKSICRELYAEYWEVSAESGENVKELFLRIAAICFDKAVLKQTESKDSKGRKVDVSQAGSKDSKGKEMVVSKTREFEMQTIEHGRYKRQDPEVSKSK